MARVPSLISLRSCYEKSPDEVKSHFWQLQGLLTDPNMLQVSIAYMFLRTEQAQNRTLYGGVVKLHRASSTMARGIIEKQHLTRQGFQDIFNNVFGQEIPEEITKKITSAESIRDKIVHGKKVEPSNMRDAIADVLEYAVEMNEIVHDIAAFRPFGNMRGFKGRAHALETKTTRWLMKGLGFGVN